MRKVKTILKLDIPKILDWFIEKAFKKGRNYLSVYSQGAKWINKPKNENSCFFDKSSFQKIVHFLVENAIFEVGDCLIKQNIGIPMGTDPGPFMANAHLQLDSKKYTGRYFKVRDDNLSSKQGSLFTLK